MFIGLLVVGAAAYFFWGRKHAYGPSHGGIEVVSATWGENCKAPAGNSTAFVKAVCEGADACSYFVHRAFIPDPAIGCAKAFTVEWKCAGQAEPSRATLSEEAEGKTVELACRLPAVENARVKVLSATYGENCGGERGNATSGLASTCDGRENCLFEINPGRLGDPVVGCVKTFLAEYTCGDGVPPRMARAGPDTSMRTIRLACR